MSNEFYNPINENWYNETVDVYAIGISILDFINNYILNFDEIDYSLLIIIESMLADNHCTNLNSNGVFCKNKELYWDENFVDLEEIHEFVNNKNKKTCRDGEDPIMINRLDGSRHFPCFKLDSRYQEKISNCRITM